jgi:hypothetical protein
MSYPETVPLTKRKQRSSNSRKRKGYLSYHRRNPTAKKEEQFEQIFASRYSIRRRRETGDTEYLTDGQPNYRGKVCALCKVEWMIHSEKKEEERGCSLFFVRGDNASPYVMFPNVFFCGATCHLNDASSYDPSLRGAGIEVGIG